MKYVSDRRLWTSEYYRYIYRQLLKEIEESLTPTMKWKKDLLLILLEESKETVTPRKILRKKVAKDIKEAEANFLEDIED
jgi:hypothetical protein